MTNNALNSNIFKIMTFDNDNQLLLISLQ